MAILTSTVVFVFIIPLVRLAVYIFGSHFDTFFAFKIPLVP